MENIMQLRYFFFAIVVVVLVMFAANSISASAVPSTNSTSGLQDALEERVEIQTDYGALNSTTKEPAASQAAPPQNGLLILESRCAKCHTAQWLKQTKKTRTEWEKTLAQMGRMGVQLSDTEKDILLDYLVFIVEP
jgi:cytochrome c5